METGRGTARPSAFSASVRIPIPCRYCGGTPDHPSGHRSGCPGSGELIEVDLPAVLRALREARDQSGQLGHQADQGLLNYGIALLRLLGKN